MQSKRPVQVRYTKSVGKGARSSGTPLVSPYSAPLNVAELPLIDEGERVRAINQEVLSAVTSYFSSRGWQLPSTDAQWALMPNDAKVHLHLTQLWEACANHDFGKSDIMVDFHARHVAQKNYAWAIPTEEALLALAKLGPLLEVGAGTGYWAHLLRQGGVDIKAYDTAPGNNSWSTGLWTEVLTGGTDVASTYPDRTLFLCWPPYDTHMAFNAAQAHLAAGGRMIAYIGEGRGGCTGDDDFHRLLEKRYTQIGRVFLPQWFGIHDALYLYERV